MDVFLSWNYSSKVERLQLLPYFPDLGIYFSDGWKFLAVAFTLCPMRESLGGKGLSVATPKIITCMDSPVLSPISIDMHLYIENIQRRAALVKIR